MTVNVTETHSPEETYELGVKIGQNCKPGQVFTLIGVIVLIILVQVLHRVGRSTIRILLMVL